MLNTALELYRKGFAPIWLLPKSKRPVEKNWTAGERGSEDYLKKTYKKNNNLGIRLGKASKLSGGFLAVIDCDVKSEEKKHLKEMLSHLDILRVGESLIVHSGRGNGSRHIYISTKKPAQTKRLAVSKDLVKVKIPSVNPSAKDKAALSAEELKEGFRLRPAWEISILGEGAQVVAPPSIHPDSGRAYKWEGDFKTLELFHFKDVEAVTERVEKSRLNDFKAVPVDLICSGLSDSMVLQITEGEGVEDRSAALFGASIAMRKAGFNEAEILSVLTDESNYLGAVAYDHTGSKSRKRAAEWILNFTLKKAEKTGDARNDFEIIDNPEEELEIDSEVASEIAGELVEVRDWRLKIERDQKEGRPRANFYNTKLILENVVGPGFLKHNEFTLEDTWLEETPWGSHKGGQVRDIDILEIKNYLVDKYRVEVTKEKIIEVLQVIGNQNSFHPVKDYLNSLEWDGVPRLDNWLYNYLGVKGPKSYVQTVGRKTLTAMCARIFNPGCAFHHVLILEGKTRHGKSETWKILAGKEWHLDNELDLSNKDSRQMLLGKWVIELAELSSVHQAGVNSMKNFISNDVDTFRKPYGRFVESFKRSCIFVGTTNNDRYLKDLTGNARYWPVKIDRLKFDDLTRDRDQLLAEAFANFSLGEKINFHSQEFYDIAEKEQAQREEGGDVASVVQELLSDENINLGNQFRTVDITRAILSNGGVPGFRSERALEMKIGNILTEIGYGKIQKRIKGIKGYWWVKNDSGF